MEREEGRGWGRRGNRGRQSWVAREEEVGTPKVGRMGLSRRVRRQQGSLVEGRRKRQEAGRRAQQPPGVDHKVRQVDHSQVEAALDRMLAVAAEGGHMQVVVHKPAADRT